MRARPSPPRSTGSGFTLAEIAVTIVIVGIGILLVMQSLNGAKLTAAHTRNLKLARMLGTYTLGEIESGVYLEEIDEDSGLQGDYSDQGFSEFTYEVVFGEEGFDDDTDEEDRAFTAWDRSKKKDEDKEDEEKVEQPYEKVWVRVRYPAVADQEDQLVLVRWVPWKQVYGKDDESKSASGSSKPAAGGASGGSGAAAGGNK